MRLLERGLDLELVEASLNACDTIAIPLGHAQVVTSCVLFLFSSRFAYKYVGCLFVRIDHVLHIHVTINWCSRYVLRQQRYIFPLHIDAGTNQAIYTFGERRMLRQLVVVCPSLSVGLILLLCSPQVVPRCALCPPLSCL